MAEVTWTEEGPGTPPKKKIPTWVWFCGGGCLAMIVLGVVAIGLGISYAKKVTDSEKQWPELAKILPFDERPQDLKLIFGNQLGMEQYQLHDERHGFTVQIQHHTGPSGTEAREEMFGSDKPKIPENLVVMKFADMQPGVIEVQGRNLRVIRMRMELAGFMKKVVPKEGQDAFGSAMFMDATREGQDGLLFVQVMREGSSEPITDEEIRELLKPFHVGPNR